MAPGIARLVNDPRSTVVWSERAKRGIYLTPKQVAFLTWLRGDGWRRTTNRAMAGMFSVSPGTIAQWIRVMESLGLIVRWSRRGRHGWTQLRRNASSFVLRRPMHAPSATVDSPPNNDVSPVPLVRALPIAEEPPTDRLFARMRHLMPFLDER